MPFVYYLQVHDLATLLPGRPTLRVARNGFVINKQMAFLKKKNSKQLLVFFFKTSGYNVECDRLWVWSNKSLKLFYRNRIIVNCVSN